VAVDSVTMAALVAVYLVLTFIIAYYAYRKTKSTEDYLVAGRSSHPAIIALSYGRTFISTSAIIGFGGQAANLGMGLIWLTVLNIGVGILLAFVFFGKKTREIGQRFSAVTFPGPDVQNLPFTASPVHQRVYHRDLDAALHRGES